MQQDVACACPPPPAPPPPPTWVPQPVAHARGSAPSSAPPLVRRRLAGPHQLQPARGTAPAVRAGLLLASPCCQDGADVLRRGSLHYMHSCLCPAHARPAEHATDLSHISHTLPQPATSHISHLTPCHISHLPHPATACHISHLTSHTLPHLTSHISHLPHPATACRTC